MPGGSTKAPKVDYPAGCKEVGEDVSKDELVRRLKTLARTLQDMGQDEENTTKYTGLAIHLASEFFLDHNNKDVRLLVACCIADVFRIFAPEAPYTDTMQLKGIFLFLTEQLRGLEDTEGANFKRYFYLLENLAWVKSFNICIELDDNQEILGSLFRLFFSIVSEKHSTRVKNFMLDMMCPLITESDGVSQDVLDIILEQIIEPHKTQNPHSYGLARDLIRRTTNAIEPYIQMFFNNTLMLGKTADSELSGHLFDLIYELNQIASNVLLAVLPQMEFKLKSNDEGERRKVTRVLGRMFSEPDSDLASQNRPLWNCYLGRFNDIDLEVRRTCVQSSQDFIINHPELVADFTEHLKSRSHDPDENVRLDVVNAIISGAKKELSHLSEDLLELVKNRTLDKKFKIRKEALMGLGQVYKRCMMKDDIPRSDQERITWIKNKVLHAYYQPNVEDKILVERLLNTALIPYSLEPKDRMKKLFIVYGNVDPHAVKALQEIFKTQLNARVAVRGMLDSLVKGNNNGEGQIMTKITPLSRMFPDPPKVSDHLRKLCKMLEEDPRMKSHLLKLVSPDCTCKRAEDCVKEILKKMGNPIPQNYLYASIKMLLERIAPVMIDHIAIKALMTYIEDAVKGIGEITDEVPNGTEKGMKLLQMLSYVYPGSFQSEEVYAELITFLKHDDDIVADVTLQIFTNIGQRLSTQFPNIFTSMIPVVQKLAKIGTLKQAKHAVKCIECLCPNKDKIFAQIFEHSKKNMDIDSPNFLTSMVAIGHMAQICPAEFENPLRSIVSKFLVKELLMQDRSGIRKSTESWYDDHLVSEETRAKIQAMKLMTRWLMGMKSNSNNSGSSTLRLLHRLIMHEGDLMERSRICKAEMARLRLQAGCSMLKLAQEKCYADIISLEQFQALAYLINDPVYVVRESFSKKLHKGLMSLRLPLQYMSVFSLAASDTSKERRAQCKQFLITNIQRRRDCLKQQNLPNSKLYNLLPDYVLPYTIHLLAHDPEFESCTDIDSLKNIKDCLWFILEPLITKNDQYSYSFYRKIIENIKQTKDAMNPENETINHKLYAVCDLALGLVMTKTANFVLKEFPAEAVLPAKLFTAPDPNYSNTKSYLPKELAVAALAKFQTQPGKKPGPLSTVTMNAASPPGDSQDSSSPSPPPPSKDQGTGTKSTTAASRTGAGSSTRGRPAGSSSQDSEPVSRSSSRSTDKGQDQDQPDRSTSGSKKQESEKKSGDTKHTGKITDFVTKKPRSTSKENKSAGRPAAVKHIKTDSKLSPRQSPRKGKDTQSSRSMRSASQALKKRSLSRSRESVVAKKKPGDSPNKPSRPVSRSLSNSQTSQRKRSAAEVSASQTKRRREKSPTSSPPSSSKSSQSKSSSQKSQTRRGEAADKKPNVRRAGRPARPITNGTSDGDSSSPGSSGRSSDTSKRRSASVAQAIEQQGKSSSTVTRKVRKMSRQR